MNYKTSYQVDEGLVLLSAKQMFYKVYLKQKWLLILGFLIIGTCILTFPGESGGDHLGVAYIVLAIGAFLAITWVKTYFSMLANTRSAFKASGGGMMDVTIEGNQIEISSAAGCRSIQLDKVTRVLETKDFLILMIDKTPIFTPLKNALSPEVITWLFDRKAGE